MVLCISILLVPLFWMIKFSGVLQERKEELMIVNGNGDGGALTIKGGPFCGESCGQGCSFMQGGDQES
jgi:hypothetical protein